MKYLLYLSTALVTGCISTTPVKPINARITYYNSHEDRYGSKIAWHDGQAREGVTVAAHPDFNFGTEIEIPELKGQFGDAKFIVEDRGKAVTSKKASRGKTYVFDVYVNRSHKQMQKLAMNLPPYMDVFIKQ
jgi:hypothetical protein